VAQVDLIEETFIAADPALVAAAVHERDFVAALWPDLELTIFMDRGLDGVRWTAAGALVGSCEVWLEPSSDGVIVHTYVRCEPTGGSGTSPIILRPRAAAQEAGSRARHAKRVLWALKDRLEAGRAPGGPAVGASPAAGKA
jgi:hypothetical protein